MLENIRELQWTCEKFWNNFRQVSTRWNEIISADVDEGWNNFEIILFHIKPRHKLQTAIPS